MTFIFMTLENTYCIYKYTYMTRWSARRNTQVFTDKYVYVYIFTTRNTWLFILLCYYVIYMIIVQSAHNTTTTKLLFLLF